jgi:hypothetical protein
MCPSTAEEEEEPPLPTYLAHPPPGQAYILIVEIYECVVEDLGFREQGSGSPQRLLM